MAWVLDAMCACAMWSVAMLGSVRARWWRHSAPSPSRRRRRPVSPDKVKSKGGHKHEEDSNVQTPILNSFHCLLSFNFSVHNSVILAFYSYQHYCEQFQSFSFFICFLLWLDQVFVCDHSYGIIVYAKDGCVMGTEDWTMLRREFRNVAVWNRN